MDHLLFMGLGLGVSAGFAPGPLTTLIISESLQHGTKAGLKVTLAPFVTDTPIVLFSLFLLAQVAGFQQVLAVISLLGGSFLLYIGIENLRIKPVLIEAKTGSSRSLLKGVFANFLSPNPYLFWISVGGPILYQATLFSAVTFLCSFYGMLIAIKMAMAILVGRSRHFLAGQSYLWVMRFMGLLLCLFALLLYRDGFSLF